MEIHRDTSNQWSIGIGLRRSTIYGCNRWMFWINRGYGTTCISWGKNPPRPMSEGKTS